MKRDGFTLIEILVTIAIIGILMSVTTLEFTGMRRKANIERQTREIYNAIVETRLSAMQNRKRQAVYIGPKQYVFKQWTSANDSLTSAWKTTRTVNVDYAMKIRPEGAALADPDVTVNRAEFDTNGSANNTLFTLFIAPDVTDVSNNCIVLHTAITNIGRMASGNKCSIQ